MEQKNIKKILVPVIAVIVLCAAVFGVFAGIRYLRVGQPLRHIQKGLNNEDSRELIKAFPPALSEQLEDDDYDEMDDDLSDIMEYFGDDFLNNDKYKFKIKVLGQKKASSKQGEMLKEAYDEIGEALDLDMELDAKHIYYTDVKLTVKSPEDKLSVTLGLYIGKISGKWYIIGGDDIVNSAFVPSMVGYVSKSKLRTANSNAKLVFTTVNSVCADMVADGRISEIKTGSVGPISVANLDLSDPVQKAVADALSGYGTKAGFVYYEIDDYYSVRAAQWAQDMSGIVGQYPNPASSLDESKELTFGEYSYDDDYWW